MPHYWGKDVQKIYIRTLEKYNTRITMTAVYFLRYYSLSFLYNLASLRYHIIKEPNEGETFPKNYSTELFSLIIILIKFCRTSQNIAN